MKFESGIEWVNQNLGDIVSIQDDALFSIIQAGLKVVEPSAAERPNARKAGVVSIIPITGVLMKRPNAAERFFEGAVNIEGIENNIKQAAADPNVKAIVLDVNSPGGSVHGIEEAAATIMQARQSKHVVAIANNMAASAAYWLASCADQIYVSPSGDVGSIGVIATHFDVSAALEKMGVKATIVKAGKYKGEGSPYQPLGEEAQAYMQERVNNYYTSFVSAVAKGRGVSAEKVRADFGHGRVVGAREAVKLGMADKVGTLEDVLHSLGASAVNIAPVAKGVNPEIAAKKLALFKKL